MENLINNKEIDIIKSYDLIIKDLIENNLIDYNVELKYPSSSKFVIDNLLSLGLNKKIIYKKISHYFNLKELSDLSKEDCIVNDLGVVSDGVFYLTNPFSNISKRVVKNNTETSFFEEVGFVSKEVYDFYKNKKEEVNEILSANYFLISLVEKAIKEGVTEIFIPCEKDSQKSKIFFNYNNNYYEIEDNYKYNFLPELENVHEFFDKEYFVDFKTIKSEGKELFFVYINKYKHENSLLEFDKKYINSLNEMIGRSNGLFLISEKNETDLYYSFLDSINQNGNKKVISFESKIKSKVKNVLQVELEENEFDLSLFDVVFIKNVNSEKQVNIIIDSLQQGKLVVVSTISQDSLTALSSLISKFNIDKYILSEKIIGVYHSTILPKVCDSCSKEYPIKESSIVKEKAFNVYSMSISPEHLISKSNKSGCAVCNHGYNGKVVVSELLENDKDVSEEIENNFNIRELRNLKESKRWETIHSYSRYLVEKNIVTIEDVKKTI